MIRIARLFTLVVAMAVAVPFLTGSQQVAAQSGNPYPSSENPYPGSGDGAPPAGQVYPDPAYPPATGSGVAPGAAPQSDTYTVDEIVETGHGFFGQVTEGLASVVEHSVASYGLPNGYILGQEASGAIVGGLRYGEGTLHTKNAGQHPIFWQGPSVGFDVGAEGSRTMMLVYNLPSIDAIHNRFAGVAGSAYLVAGVGMTVLAGKGIYIVPIVSGVGARLGVNIGYLKFTPSATWNPF